MFALLGGSLLLVLNYLHGQQAAVRPALGITPATTVSPVATRPTATAVPLPHTPTQVQGVHMLNSTTGWITCTDGSVLRTVDGGLNWKDVTPQALLAIKQKHTFAQGLFPDTSTAWIIVEVTLNTTSTNNLQSVVFHSSDSGQTWQKAALSSSEPYGKSGPQYAYVLGSSGGALVGLDLVARHPEQVHTLIAHEPPTHLLPDHDPIQAIGRIRETYLREGIGVALQQLAMQPGLNADDYEMDIDMPAVDQEQRDQFVKNAIFLFEREFSMYDRYQLDFAALKSAQARSRVVIAGGASNHEDETYWSAVAVAERLGTTLVEFPGRHVGYVTNPTAFARRLDEVLSVPSLP
jgi:hypothetical protein